MRNKFRFLEEEVDRFEKVILSSLFNLSLTSYFVLLETHLHLFFVTFEDYWKFICFVILQVTADNVYHFSSLL